MLLPSSGPPSSNVMVSEVPTSSPNKFTWSYSLSKHFSKHQASPVLAQSIRPCSLFEERVIWQMPEKYSSRVSPKLRLPPGCGGKCPLWANFAYFSLHASLTYTTGPCLPFLMALHNLSESTDPVRLRWPETAFLQMMYCETQECELSASVTSRSNVLLLRCFL